MISVLYQIIYAAASELSDGFFDVTLEQFAEYYDSEVKTESDLIASAVNIFGSDISIKRITLSPQELPA